MPAAKPPECRRRALDLFQKHAAAAGLPRIPLYVARHSAASLLASTGTPIIVAAGLLGHHPHVYASTYAHLYPEDKQKPIGGLEAILLAGAQRTWRPSRVHAVASLGAPTRTSG